jgi:hypothetical protein
MSYINKARRGGGGGGHSQRDDACGVENVVDNPDAMDVALAHGLQQLQQRRRWRHNNRLQRLRPSSPLPPIVPPTYAPPNTHPPAQEGCRDTPTTAPARVRKGRGGGHTLRSDAEKLAASLPSSSRRAIADSFVSAIFFTHAMTLEVFGSDTTVFVPSDSSEILLWPRDSSSGFFRRGGGGGEICNSGVAVRFRIAR